MVVQWHRVLDRALAESPVVGVADAVEQHLGRTPTRSELTAARRAAHRFAASGEGQVRLLPSVVAGRQRRILVLAHPEVDLSDVAALRQAVADLPRMPTKPQGQRTKDTSRRAESLLTQVSQAARAARLLPVTNIEPAHARLLAQDLTEAVAELATLAAGLTRRSRQHMLTIRDEAE